ncbi:MAG: hypothetical protein NT062_10490, partial [Proteobacteria bacterium]|nr:hypothetical protein [Pseudomonadota bacterium]
GKFRETMWFKKGDLDSAAAVAAEEERTRTGKDDAANPGAADTLPIDERYKDDGSISRDDKDKYSLRTGATTMMASIKDPTAPSASMSNAKVSEGDLIGEMKGGRTWVVALILAGVVGVGVLIFFIAR